MEDGLWVGVKIGGSALSLGQIGIRMGIRIGFRSEIGIEIFSF